MEAVLANFPTEISGEQVTEHSGGGEAFGEYDVDWFDLALEQEVSWLADGAGDAGDTDPIWGPGERSAERAMPWCTSWAPPADPFRG